MTYLSSRTNMIELAERAKPHYVSELPYHDWEHALDVMRVASQLARRAIVSEIADHHDLLVIAAAWHDADYHETDMRGFRTKEERSADLAAQSLPELSDAERTMLVDGIIDTTVAKSPKSGLFGAVLHAADVGYFAAPTEHFMERLTLMRHEWSSPDWSETVERTVSFGKEVKEESRELMPRFLTDADAADWLRRIDANLTYLQDTTPESYFIPSESS